jgi:hypothetical protein
MLRAALCLGIVVSICAWNSVQAEDSPEMTFAGGKLSMTMPKGWVKKEPKKSFIVIDHECEIPAAGEDKMPGRMTISSAGGSVDDNIARWFSQYDDKQKSDKQELTIAGQTVHYVDIVGTFKDSAGGGPFAGGAVVKRENYRMLGAIIVTEKAGQQFIKCYGPKATIDANEEAIKKMLDGLKTK